jgi:hypothetical protein
MVREAFGEAAQHRRSDLGQRGPVAVGFDGFRFQPRHLQHLRHVLGHLARVLEDTARKSRALLPGQALAALREARRGAGHHRERRAQVVGDRREQLTSNALRFRRDLEARLLARLGPRIFSEPGDDEPHCEHDREGEDVLHVFHRESARRGHEGEVEGGDAQDRGRDRRAAAVAQCHEYHGEQVDHGDVDQVETWRHGEAGERARPRGAHGPGVAGPVALRIHEQMYSSRGVKNA